MTTKLSFKHCLVLVLIMICFICFSRASICFAANDLDGLGGNSQTTNSNQNYSSKNNNSEDNAVSDYLKGRTPVTPENMKSANQLAGPIASAIGTATGFILIIVSSLIFFITALDLLYIGVPPLRNILNPVGAAPQGGAPMGGMGMMGGMGASPQPQTQVRKWVSDEAIAAVALANPQAGGSPMGGSPFGGGGMGMGMGMGMPGAGATAPSQSTKSVVFTYLKKRMFFIIVFTVCSIVLMSSVLTDCGINLSKLLLKVLMRLNGSMANVNI